MDPYGFGGDPVNGVDLYGLWKIGLGITIGWDSNSGFSVGVGAAADVGDYGGFDLSATRSFRDGSWTYTAGSTVNVNVYGWNLYGGGSYSYNSHTGSTLSGFTGANYMGYGGGETGGSLYWDKSGNYQGATLYQEFYGGIYGMRSGTGYEWGFGGMEGRGLYQEASGYGFYASYAQNGGLSYGGKENVASYGLAHVQEEKTGEDKKYSYLKLGWKEWDYDHTNRDKNQPQFSNYQEFLAYAEKHGMDVGEYSALASSFHDSDQNYKVWMQQGGSSWWNIPSIEGVFNFETGRDAGASYNYGNNLVSHFALDVVPYLVFDKAGL